MKNGFLKMVLSFVLLSTISLISAQDGEVSAEDRYFSNPRTKLINEQATVNNRESKQLAIENLKDMFSEGGIKEGDRDLHNILNFLVLEGSKIKIYNGSQVVNNYADVRISGCNLLGQLKGENSMYTLVEVVRVDKDANVLAEAFIALGKIGLNPNNEVLREMSATMLAEDVKGPKHNLATAYLDAIENILNSTGTINESNTFNMINRIIMLNMYGKKIQTRAREVQVAIQKKNK